MPSSRPTGSTGIGLEGVLSHRPERHSKTHVHAHVMGSLAPLRTVSGSNVVPF